MVTEILLGALAEAIFGVIIEDLAQQPRLAKVREKLRGDSPEKLVLQRTLAAAYKAFSTKFPDLAASFFDELYLQQPDVARELAKLLTPDRKDRKPDPAVLAGLWAAQFGQRPKVDLQAPITFFVETLAGEIKAQPALRPFVDSRALEQLYQLTDIRAGIDKLVEQGWQAQPQPAPPQPAIPFQRPPRAEHFTGRETELAKLLDELHPGHVATLCGIGGIGKTALATEALQDDTIPERFPDGIIFYSFYGKPNPAQALEHIIVSFGDEARPTLDDAARRVLAGKRVLLVLDGGEEATDLQAVLGVRGDQCGVLVTSQNNEDALAEWQDIDRLPLDEAVELLQAWGKEQVADLVVAAQICEEVDRLPMAVRLAGRYLSQKREPAGEYLIWLQANPIDALRHGEHRHENIQRLIERSLSQVSETARQVLSVAGLLALASFGQTVVGVALDRSIAGLRRPLNQLVSYGLLLREGKRYQVGHALIHTYVRRRLIIPTDALERMAEYYVIFAHELSEQGADGYAHLAAEREHMMRVLAGCIEQEHWEAARVLMGALADHLEIQGGIVELQTALKYGIIAATQAGHRHYEGDFLQRLGNAYRESGQVEQAIEVYQQALTVAREIGNRQGEGVTLNSLGIGYLDLGLVDNAIVAHEQALIIARELRDRQSECNRLGNLGNAYLYQLEVDVATYYFKQALTIAQEIGDRRLEGAWLSGIGTAYLYREQVKVATDYFEQALAIAQEIGDRPHERIHAWNLGLLYEETDPARAVALMSILVDYFREIGHPGAEARAEQVAKIRARLADDKEAGEGEQAGG